MTTCVKVLVATASSNLQKLICRMLQRSGYATDEVDSAAAALEAARTSRYEAVVTDMHLPDCCGATLVNRMREAGVATPAILLVEAETPRVREAASALDATRCLRSPELDRLGEIIALVRAGDDDAQRGEA
ncbi:MAG: response regulator [Deltaproteobacteria bacterium]|nr:response regulator [Deltaproteobacteria bacterium]